MAETVDTNAILPPEISVGAKGSLWARDYDIFGGKTGNKEIRIPKSSRRGKWVIGYGTQEVTAAKIDEVYDIYAAFEVGYAFLFQPPEEHASCIQVRNFAVTPLDQAIGTGDGATATFQLKKTRTAGSRSTSFNIYFPIAGTVRVAVAGTEKTITTHFTVSATTGIVTFTGGNTPTAGQAITAGYKFRVATRFDNESLDPSITRYSVHGIPQLTLREVLPPYA